MRSVTAIITIRAPELSCTDAGTVALNKEVMCHSLCFGELQAISQDPQPIYLFVDDAKGWLLVALAEIQVLTFPSEGHHVLLKDVTSLWGISKILHMVKDARLAVGCYKKINSR